MQKGLLATVLNATLYAFAHLMFWNWVVLLVSFLGGLLFARSYRQRGLVEAWALHGVTGFVLFAVGIGSYFTSEASARPFGPFSSISSCVVRRLIRATHRLPNGIRSKLGDSLQRPIGLVAIIFLPKDQRQRLLAEG
ncbi:hypothetical protein [Salipiger sp. IMCC34102]|uniref:hypothetical protein n=1 Tax=Salipiger sp. IMCC34102 TaxID=2510647 RepID=UPI0013EE10CF|nr:hypothetical protein [Salipiger sp. IMCC34102]